MKKKLALILVATAMLLSSCSSTASSSETSSDGTASEPVVSSSDTSTASDTTSSASSAASVGTSSITSSTISTTSTVSTPKTSTPTASKASSVKASSTPTSTGGAIGSMGSNPTSKLPKRIDMCITGFMGESTDNPDQKAKWEKSLSERYGVEIKVTLPPKADVTTFLTTRIAAGDLKGMVYRYSPDDVVSAMYEGYIIPIDEYLKDNKTWNSLPEAMRNNYKIDGKIWAVPMALKGYGTGAMWSRYFRKDWMTALKLQTPKTVDEAKAVITAFATGDPDGDGNKANNVGVTFGDPMNYMDLFAAQDALTFEQGSNIGYHPGTKAYEDAYLRPGAKSVFELLRYFAQNKYCDTTAFITKFADLRIKLSSGIIGSVFFYGGQGKYTWGPTVYNLLCTSNLGRKMDYDLYPDDWAKATNIYEEVSMLTGTVAKNTWAVATDGGPWTLMKGTPEPKETVNFFVDLMYSSGSNFMESTRNLKEYWSKNSDGTFTIAYKDAANKVGYAGASLISFVEPSLYPQAVYGQVYYPDATSGTKARNLEMAQYNGARDAKCLSNGQLYTIKPEYKTVRSATYQKFSGDATNYANQLMIESATNPNVTVDKALADYKKNMANIGGDQMLKEANAAFGMTNNYQSYK